MFHTLAKWFISRAIDLQSPLPVWLQSWIDRHAELVQFQRESRQLVDRLRGGAASWIAADDARRRRVSREPSKRLPPSDPSLARWPLWIGGIAVAACVTFFCVVGSSRSDTQNRLAMRGPSAPETPAVEALTGGTLLVDSFGVCQQVVSVVPSRLKALGMRDPRPFATAMRSWQQPARSSTSFFANILAAIDAGMAEERGALAHHARSSVVFLVRKLPQSTARVLLGRPIPPS